MALKIATKAGTESGARFDHFSTSFWPNLAPFWEPKHLYAESSNGAQNCQKGRHWIQSSEGSERRVLPEGLQERSGGLWEPSGGLPERSGGLGEPPGGLPERSGSLWEPPGGSRKPILAISDQIRPIFESPNA